MATFIATTLDNIDGAIETYAETVFEGVSGPVNTVLVAGGVLGLALIAANSVLAFSPINMRTYVIWAIRYVIILAVATSWSQFEPIYNILTDVPQSYGGALLARSGAGVGTNEGLNAIMDTMVTSIFTTSDQMNATSGWLGISVAAVLLSVLGALMACVAILVSAMGKIGIAMAVSLAPIAISALLFSGSRQLFESWSRFTIGFALIPLVLAGVMGAVLGVGNSLINTTGTATSLSDIAGFLIVVLAAIFMMKSVPTLATSLAGSVVAAGSGIVEARAAATSLKSGIGAAGRIASSPVTAAYGAAARLDAGRQAAEGVKERGGGSTARMAAFVTQAARMSKDRQRYSDLSYMRGPSEEPSTEKPEDPT